MNFLFIKKYTMRQLNFQHEIKQISQLLYGTSARNYWRWNCAWWCGFRGPCNSQRMV